jgi:hypothetical protein
VGDLLKHVLGVLRTVHANGFSHAGLSAEPYYAPPFTATAPPQFTAPEPSSASQQSFNGKSVQFADATEEQELPPSGPPSPDEHRHRRRRRRAAPESDPTDTETETETEIKQHRHRRRRERERQRDREEDDDHDQDRDRDRRRHRSSRHDNGDRVPSPAGSDDTIDMPDRFDRHGRKKAEKGEDPIADKIEEFLTGDGGAGKLFKTLTDKYLGGDSSGGKRW